MVGALTKTLEEVYISPLDNDVRVWCPTSFGKFSVKSFCSVFIAENQL